jgi:hypothetical protein
MPHIDESVESGPARSGRTPKPLEDGCEPWRSGWTPSPWLCRRWSRDWSVHRVERVAAAVPPTGQDWPTTS